MDQQTQQSPQGQPVGWGPTERKGTEIDRVPLDGEDWGLIEIDGWYRRHDLGDFFQRDPRPGKTAPMVLAVRAKDLIPVAAQAPAKVAPVGLREDAAEAVRLMREILACGLVGKQKDLGIALERTLSGIRAAVEQG